MDNGRKEKAPLVKDPSLIAQFCGCKMNEDSSVTAFVSNQEAEFYGVYIGKPGDFKHFIDCADDGVARHVATTAIEDGHAGILDDKTFDAKSVTH